MPIAGRLHKIVEHVWLDGGGEHFDSSSEIDNSAYWLFASLTMVDLTVIMHRHKLKALPNIVTLIDITKQELG